MALALILPTLRSPESVVVVARASRRGICTDPSCRKRSRAVCLAPLRGRKHGEVCGREICSGDRCAPHRRSGA